MVAAVVTESLGNEPDRSRRSGEPSELHQDPLVEDHARDHLVILSRDRLDLVDETTHEPPTGHTGHTDPQRPEVALVHRLVECVDQTVHRARAPLTDRSEFRGVSTVAILSDVQASGPSPEHSATLHHSGRRASSRSASIGEQRRSFTLATIAERASRPYVTPSVQAYFAVRLIKDGLRFFDGVVNH